jgi:hypothetical protein
LRVGAERRDVYRMVHVVLERLRAALEGRYAIERKLGSGGMACQAGWRTGGQAGSCDG